jgi:pimeloyl-ACP methyl ester carboxylesterase
VPGAELALLPGADHMLCVGRPVEFTQVLTRFFRDAEGRAAVPRRLWAP